MKVSTTIIVVAASLTLFAGCAMAKNPQVTQQPNSGKVATSQSKSGASSVSNTSGASITNQAPTITLATKNMSGASIITMMITNAQNVSKVKLNGLNNLSVIGQNVSENSQNGVGQITATYTLAPTVGSYVLNASGVVNGEGITSNTINLTLTKQDVTNFQNYVQAQKTKNMQNQQKMQQLFMQQMKEQQQLMNQMNQNMIQMQQMMMQSN